MAWAVFTRRFDWTRPGARFSWGINPRPEPQSYPHDVIEAAVAAGKAHRVESPNRSEARALKAART